MIPNIGRLDQEIRMATGLGLIAFAFIDNTPYRWIGLIGLVLVVTALVRFCPAYKMLRITTAALPAGPGRGLGS